MSSRCRLGFEWGRDRLIALAGDVEIPRGQGVTLRRWLVCCDWWTGCARCSAAGFGVAVQAAGELVERGALGGGVVVAG
jgi:hypothetical protein